MKINQHRKAYLQWSSDLMIHMTEQPPALAEE
jgi:hypothetical protein